MQRKKIVTVTNGTDHSAAQNALRAGAAPRSGLLARLLRRMPVRERYLLTRRGGLRLRFYAPCLAGLFAVVLALGGGFFAASSAPAPLSYAQARSADPGDNHAPPARLAAAADLETPAVPAAPAQPQEKVLKVGKGDTLAGVLQKAGVGAGEAYAAVTALAEYLDPRKIRAGQEIQVRFDPVDESGDSYLFSGMQIDLDPVKSVQLTRDDSSNFAPAMVEKEVAPKLYARRADIQVSLYGAAEKAGIPAAVIAEAIRMYSWDIDFQRDIRKGDSIELMYEQMETPEGLKVSTGDVLYARLEIGGVQIPLYRFEMADGRVDYFNEKGESIRKSLMQTPIDGARLSSGYGMRKHPVLGYDKMHKGVDFAAPRGTPVYAAGDGTVEKAGPFSSYGNYVRIRHNGDLKTAYAHLHGFAKGIRVGSRVKQGQVIGYVGSTGRSTGPHLHYEVMVANRHVNPKSIKNQQGEKLKGEELRAFRAQVTRVDRQYAALTRGTTLAMRGGAKSAAPFIR